MAIILDGTNGITTPDLESAGPVTGTTATFTGLVTTAGQIKFPATQNASSDANTLDDYEEGTWTPTLSSDGTPPTVSSYSTRTGTYTKIGNLVVVTCSIRATISSIGTGTPRVTGMPFADAGFLDGVAFGICDLLVNTPPPYSYVSNSSVYFGSTYRTSPNAYMTFTVSYRVA